MVALIQDVWTGVSINFPEDERLRSFGFTVACRPTYGEPQWRLGRHTYSHGAALQYCRELEAMNNGAARGNAGAATG